MVIRAPLTAYGRLAVFTVLNMGHQVVFYSVAPNKE